ncbi:3-methylcrotonoyl-CoA carboxylase alpha subunit [Methylosinus sp. sav-2]|uniref:ATP-binding protein n=1 Tax=Methylosinus sp. sav-2 TaxID=2485168 RepID=UPI000478B491|nr:biotin carboxylase N-terminal domain-containing protein [Methylosinus sp. sav-2]TDX67317.1 3-methylcrotonoyl-CoA carboxylase alpha subunit [Methylosinus sp. sav-2]
MFRKILIANRGEIACRVIATARRMSIIAAAVYSDVDAHARHVALADEAYPLGAAPARESYLAIDKIIAVARRAGAQAVHPGYGFLSENAAFAERCAEAGLVFIGPTPQAMRLMGSKTHARALMESAGVPIVPGFHGAQDTESLVTAATRIGFPVLVKASAGGGGKGMRHVATQGELRGAIESARREAASAFGDDSLLIEKALDGARHIEAQIFGDTHGALVAFPERDCSIQRRHQKIIEETPAPGLSTELRCALREAALAAGRAVSYIGAGTVEFLVTGDSFYFLEMNTRLQVEHPVTEMISGVDLVEWQLRVAAGEPLPAQQDEIARHGHAIEARLYAEAPARDFLPCVGRLEHWRTPREDGAIRVETGVREGDAVTPFYDPLLAKIVAHGEDRETARAKLAAALRDCEIVGVETNLLLLRAILDSEAHAAGEIDTGFLPRHLELILAGSEALDEDAETIVLAAGAAAWLRRLRAERNEESPWNACDAWRLNGAARQKLLVRLEDRDIPLTLAPLPKGAFRLQTPKSLHCVALESDAGRMSLRVDGVARKLSIVERANGFVIIWNGRTHELSLVDPLAPPRAERDDEAALAAPLPARVTGLFASVGESVKKGAPLVMLEAMKMEIALSAPRDGRISEIRTTIGDMVRQGERLIVFAEGEAA